MYDKLNIKIVKGRNCFYANLAIVLSYYGYNYSEAELFFLSSSADIFFNESVEKDINKIVTMYSCDEAADRIAKTLTIKKRAILSTENIEMTQKNIIGCLRNNFPVICMVNQKVLDYHPQYYIELEDARHGIIIYGYESKQQIFYLADSFVLNRQGIIRDYEGYLFSEVLLKNLYGYMWFEPEKEKPMIMLSNNAIMHFVKNNLIRMLCVEKENDTYIGNYSIKKGFDYLENAVTKQIIDNEEILVFIHFLKMRYVIIFDYVIDILNNFDNRNTLWKKYMYLKNEWDHIVTRMLMIIYSRTNIIKIHDKVNALIKMQNEIITETLYVLDNVICKRSDLSEKCY